MLDDGVKAAGVDEDEVKVADISMHLLEAIERGERDFQDSLVVPAPERGDSGVPT
jgi:hypothetical protein